MKNGKIGFCGIFAAFALAASLGLSARASDNFYADANGVLHIVNRAGLTEFRDQANAGTIKGLNQTGGHTNVVLDADIDLESEEWTPINTSCVDFDGQNHVVSNLKVTGNAKNVGLFGAASISTVKNLTVSNAVVTGINHVAAIAGDGLCGHFINCKVYNATITTAVYNNDDGDKAGAICGYLSGEPNAEVTGCTVENCTITGYRDCGGVVGYANGTASVTGTTVKNTKVINDRSVNYKNYTTDAAFDVNEVIGETSSSATVKDNTATGVTVKVAVAKVDGAVYTDLHDALTVAATKGKVCTLLSDVALTGTWTPVADFNGTFDGNGYTITGLTVEGGSNLGLFANTGTEATIKDLTITGAAITSTSGNNHGVLAGSISGSTIGNVKILNSTVTAAGGQYTGGLCGNGYPAVSKCEVAGCTIKGKDQVGGLIGYFWVGHIENSYVTNNTVTATEERAGGLVGKIQIAAGNLGSSTMWVNGNVVSGTATAPDMAGGLFAQIMGDVDYYSIANNDIDVKCVAVVGSEDKFISNPIGNLRASQNAAFTGALKANITGNCWSDATLAANSFTYANVASGVDPQVINRDNPSVIVETGDEEGEHQAMVVTKKSSTETQTTSVPQEAASITTEKVTVDGKTTTVAEQIEQTTKVEGVKLTTNETVVVQAETLSGVQAVVSEAKLQAIAITNEVKEATAAEKAEAQTFAEKIVTAAKVEVKVEVTVTPTEYVKPAEETTGTMAFKLEPKATVKIIENNEAVATQVVDVDNDMIDQTQPITVSIFTGFNPVQIVHSDNDGNFIEAFEGDDIAYDETTGIATVAIDHFSTLTAYDAEVVDPLQPVGSTKVADGFYQNAETYAGATEFYITKLNGFHFFRDLINQDNGAIDDYIEKGFYSSTADNFYTENPFKGKTVRLLCDVDEGDVVVKPIGMTAHSRDDKKDKRYFYGIFDGCNHTVSNLRVIDDPPTTKHRVGLFGQVTRNVGVPMAGVVNLTVSNAVVSGYNYVGGFVGGLNGVVTLTNCHLTGSVSLTGTSSYVGGIVGHNGDSVDSQIVGCSVDVASGSTLTAKSQGGGIVGYMGGGDIIGCTVRGLAISASGSYVLGGIAGKFGETGCVAASNTVDSVTITAKSAGASGSVIGSFGAAGQTLIDNTVVNTHVYDPGPTEVFGQCHWFAQGDTTTVIGWNSVGTLTAGGITGGTYERLPTTYVADGYEKVAQGTTPETWVVQEASSEIEVTPETVQTVLDSAKEGDTIILTEGDYGVLYLRNNGEDANRIFENITIKVKTGDAVTVEQIAYQQKSGKCFDVENLTIDGITFDNPSLSGVYFDCSGAGCLRVNGLLIENCSKTGNNSSGKDYGMYTFASFQYDSENPPTVFAGDTSLECGYHNIQIVSNAITKVYMPIAFQNGGLLDGLTVVSNVFTECTDNHIQKSGVLAKGSYVITDNTIIGMTGRFARISGATSDMSVTVTNNTVIAPLKYDTGNDGSIFKVTGAAGFTVKEEDNDWNDGEYKDSGATYIAQGDTSLLPIAQVTIGSTVTKYSDLHEALEAAKASGAVCELLSDVDLTGKSWTPVGTADGGSSYPNAFKGTFNGNGHTISGLNVSGEDQVGLIGFINYGVVSNLTISGATVTGTGTQVGVAAGGMFHGTISDVKVFDSTVSGSGKYVGAILGGSVGLVKGCVATGNTITGKDQVGGLMGYLASGSLLDCVATNVVTATEERAGGLVGKCNTDSEFFVERNSVGGSASAPDFAGGAVAQIMGGGDYWAIKNNDIDVALTEYDDGKAETVFAAGPVAILRPDQDDDDFCAAIPSNITGNWWTDKTSTANSYTFTGDNVSAEKNYTIYRGVATIGETPYKTLAAAIDAAQSGQIVQLICDVALDDVLSIGQDLSVTLDLNGQAIVSTSDVAFEVNGGLIVRDSAENGLIEHSGAYNMFDVNGSVVVSNGSFATSAPYGIFYVNDEVENATIHVIDGVFAATYDGDENSVIAGFGEDISATLVVDGGTFTSDQWFLTATGADITLNGGTFNGTASLSVSGSMTITGGRFAAEDLQKESDGTLAISGGIFSFEPKAGVADGYRVEENTGSEAADYPFAVVLAPFAQVVSEDGSVTNEFMTLQAAFDAVEANETIEVLKDSDENVVVTKVVPFYFNSNGHTLSGAAPAAPTGWKFVKVGDICTLGEIVDTGDETTAVVVTAPQSASVDTNSVPASMTEEVLTSVVQNTVVTGVKLVQTNETIAISGAQSVVDLAKETGTVAFSNNLEKATNVIIQVDVEVKPTVYTAPVAEKTEGSIKFDLKPVATVMIDEGGENKTNTVDVTNEMIDQLQDITVTVYTGFRPVQAIHTDKDGNKEMFASSEIVYDEVTGNATIVIHHFSDVVFYEAVKEFDGAKVTGCSDGTTEKEVSIPGEWLRANDITDEVATNKTVTANGLPAWQSYVLGLDPNETLAAGSIVVLPQSDGAVDVMFAGWTGTVQAGLATVTFKFYADTEVDGAFETAVSQTGDGYFEDMDLVESVHQDKRFFKNASVTFVWKAEE